MYLSVVNRGGPRIFQAFPPDSTFDVGKPAHRLKVDFKFLNLVHSHHPRLFETRL